MRRHSRQGQPPSPQRQSRKRHRALCSVAMTLSVVTLGACSSSADTVAARHDAVQHSLDALVSEDGLPAALASIQDRNGNSHNYTAGVGDLTTGSEVPPNGQIRIGSNTKTFTAVVVLQLVAEGKIELDTPIETYLPDSSAETGSTATTSPSANSSNTPADSPTTATTWKTKSDITTHANFSTSRSNILPTSPPERVGSTATPTTSSPAYSYRRSLKNPSPRR